jgi:hypothetical protein
MRKRQPQDGPRTLEECCEDMGLSGKKPHECAYDGCTGPTHGTWCNVHREIGLRMYLENARLRREGNVK